jgi:uncharacterized repeat protein (TIGR01451 family)
MGMQVTGLCAGQRVRWRPACTASAWAALCLLGAPAQGAGSARVLIGAPVSAGQLVSLPGSTRPEAARSNDRGRVPDSQPLEHLQLVLKRPAEREVALKHYIDQLHDPHSANFHRWLDNAAFAEYFGLADRDLATILAWLEAQGFKVGTVYPSTMVVDFSGTAAQVAAAFHTEIHYLEVRGVRHLANMSDPMIPAALAPAVAGIVSLNDFRPRPAHRARAAYTVSAGQELVAPGDLAVIYNLDALFSAGISGAGQTIVVIQDSNLYSTADWSAFRSAFGLTAFASGSLTTTHPPPTIGGESNCANPGVVPTNEREAALDVEWASAAAPNAAIVLASCADTTTTFGGLIALQNLINGASPPAIVTMSFGECEAENGAAGNLAFYDIFQQAAALGASVFVSAGDEGAASCDADQATATHGIGVSGFASTPYDVAVGGTDFGDAYAGTAGSYWSPTNTATFESALSYIPEIPWNDSCASALIARVEGFSTTYGASGFCNSAVGANFLTTASGSGGPSGCATGAPSVPGVVSGSCAGWPKPSWQAGPGVPSDGVRDLPDVSLFAANGVWGHYYVYCDSDTADGGAVCSGAPSGWSGAGGTSFGAPILAGIQALVNQHAGARQGDPTYVYYGLAAAQTQSTLSCNSTGGNQVSSGCVFYDVTLGDMDVNCTGSASCYLPSGTNGVLSVQSSSFAVAYGSGTGWNFATGVGTINAANLVNFWSAANLTLSVNGSVNGAGQLSYAAQATNPGPQAATGVAVTSTLPAGFALVTASSSAGCAQSGQLLTCTVGGLAVGATATLIIVIQPVGSEALLSFTVSSKNPTLDPNRATVATALEVVSSALTDGPLPPWASVLLGLALLALARARHPYPPQ